MKKNAAGQYFYVQAFNASGEVTGDAGNIGCTLSIDGGARSSLADAHPTEIANGMYRFDLTQAETNGHELSFNPSSTSTGSGVQVKGSNGNVIYTTVEDTTDGIYSITVTVEDTSGDAVQGARVTINGTTYSEVSSSLGALVLNVDGNTTYSLVTSPPSGYETPAATAVVVAESNTTATIVLTPTAVAEPDDPALATLTVKCVDENGAVEAGVTIEARLTTIPASGTGYAYDAKKQSATSNASGVASLTVVRGAVYEIKRGTSKQWERVTIPDAASTTVKSIVGAD